MEYLIIQEELRARHPSYQVIEAENTNAEPTDTAKSFPGLPQQPPAGVIRPGMGPPPNLSQMPPRLPVPPGGQLYINTFHNVKPLEQGHICSSMILPQIKIFK